MKKLCKKLFIAFFAVLAITACSQDSLLESENVISAQKTELQGRELANNLLASFGNSVTRNSELVYPDYYGGMYLDNAGTLVIMATSDDLSSCKKEFSQRCKGDNFELKQCKFSLNELNKGIETIKEKFNASPFSLFKDLHLKSFWISEKENMLYIGLSDLSSENTNRVKAVLGNLPYANFKKVDNIEFQSEIEAGSPINSKFGASKSSLGYRAKYNGEIGFVVAAHAMITMGKVSLGDISSDEIGQVKIIDESVDAAFCALFSGFTASKMTYDFKTLTSNVATVIFGDKVSICGRYNNGSGTVLSTNYNLIGPNGTPIWGAIQASYNSQDGDSGAVVYTTTGNNIAGMHSAAITTNSVRNAIFIPASSINRALSLTMY